MDAKKVLINLLKICIDKYVQVNVQMKKQNILPGVETMSDIERLKHF